MGRGRGKRREGRESNGVADPSRCGQPPSRRTLVREVHQPAARATCSTHHLSRQIVKIGQGHKLHVPKQQSRRALRRAKTSATRPARAREAGKEVRSGNGGLGTCRCERETRDDRAAPHDSQSPRRFSFSLVLLLFCLIAGGFPCSVLRRQSFQLHSKTRVLPTTILCFSRSVACFTFVLGLALLRFLSLVASGHVMTPRAACLAQRNFAGEGRIFVDGGRAAAVAGAGGSVVRPSRDRRSVVLLTDCSIKSQGWGFIGVPCALWRAPSFRLPLANDRPHLSPVSVVCDLDAAPNHRQQLLRCLPCPWLTPTRRSPARRRRC